MMLAEYNLQFPSSISSLGEDTDLLGTSDDLFHLDVNLLHVISDEDYELDSLHQTSSYNHFLSDDVEDLQLEFTDDGFGLQDGIRGKMDGVFGSPSSDYTTRGYLSPLHDDDGSGIGENELLLASNLLQSDLDLAYSIELSDSDDSLACSTQSVVNSCPGSPTAKRKNIKDLQWSEMDSDEQERALCLITSAISDRASIREQLELLRIIGQDMTVLPSDSRFQIDAANMDDDKLISVRAYLSQMALHTSEDSAQTLKESHHSENAPRHKKTQERRAQHKTHRKRRAKERKQTQKEKRSRLFDQEVVLSLQHQDEDDDQEINILD